MHVGVFYKAFRSIRDYRIQYGRSITVINKNGKPGVVKEYIIKFEHFGALRFHLKQLTGEKLDINDYFRRS